MIPNLTRAAVMLLAAGTVAACGAASADPPPSSSAPAGGPAAGATESTVWQLGPFALLVRGEYDGILSAGEVKRHGDMGLAAADALNGEMALVDGVFYQFLADGRVVRSADSMRLPFAEVTSWRGGTDVALRPGLAFAGAYKAGVDSTFNMAVDSLLPTTDAFYALRIEGTWDVVVTRTFRQQTKPYPPLGQAVATQAVFTLNNVRGTMVGFRQPSYADSLGIPKYHLHFVTADGARGGHVLSFTTRDARLQYSERPDFTLRMPPAP